MKDYKKILEGVVNIVNAIENSDIDFDTIRAYISENCPELKESEDERIRKALIDGFTVMKESKNCGKTFSNYNIPVADILAWLERQGDYSKLVGEMKKRKELLSKEKENATSDNDKLSLGGRIAMLEELLVFVNEEQGEPVEINPNEFDSRLNKLLKQFETLPKEELISSLSFYLNVVQNNGTYKSDEKQGQKVDNKVESKFMVGDWIVNNDNDRIYQIKSIKNYEYCLWSPDSNIEGSLRIANVDNNFHLWDITKDAKKGDVLVHNGCTFIFIGIENGIVQAYEENLLDGNKTCNFGEPDKDNDYSPATEEQRDLLCQKMKEADYEFDFDKKELKKIEQKPPIVNFKARDWDVSKVDGKIYNAKFMEEPLTNQKRRLEIEKAAMSATGIIEQEEWFIKGAEWSDKNSSYISSENQGEQKSFDYENANIPQKDSTWGEEDKHWVQKVIDFMNHPDLIKATPTLAKDTINWLKSLKDRVQPQSKQEWSEEDESNFQGIIDELKANKHHATDYEHMTYYRLLSWFKSLKERYVWKPSDEQIEALDWALSLAKNCGDERAFDLRTLQDQLKKLRE